MHLHHARIVIGGFLGLCLAATTLNSQGAGGQAAGPASSAAPSVQARWYKGNTHTHTINQGGDSTPDEVVRWYREHGYQFVVLTDHNLLTKVDGLNSIYRLDEQFVVVPGEEVTSRSGDKPVHVNGLDVQHVVKAHEGGSVVDTLQGNIDGIRSASGVPHINHPNFGWGLTTQDLQQARNYRLFEIHNGHPTVNNLGGGGVPGMEEVWDRLLSAGKVVYGIAVDDAHVFKQPGNPSVSGPGRGWVTVRAARLEPKALMESLERGDFYASTGVVIEDVRATAKDLTVRVKVEGVTKHRIQFIGRGGKLLREATDPIATYEFAGGEGYVRAKVIDSNGRMAWVQPVQVSGAGSTAWLRQAFHDLLARWS
ncbi:MAG TPA: CehA/McbA family metallohydrolase [Vicinamibacterales bacterium]|nr:CehA/McbA family metallohydrolase [Vicinamibacterales bacterium]